MSFQKRRKKFKTISDFVAYEKEHNIRKLVFVYQSIGGDLSNSELVLNVNELTNIIPGVSYSDETYKKTTFGIQEDNFDV
ncbi:hypothetical protein [Enterococcus sp. DIV0187]|uniref:hypothetical protein n=1 Tax=Enterococcus sp. DIV0187 TaxID=2774644 RepID=UPI003F2929C3